MAKAPGIPHPIKLQEQHRVMFPANEPITEESGKRVAQWAAGGAAPDFGMKLTNAATLDELAAAWKAIPKAEQPKYAASKDERKAALTGEQI